jgi:hypothetical protein
VLCALWYEHRTLLAADPRFALAPDARQAWSAAAVAWLDRPDIRFGAAVGDDETPVAYCLTRIETCPGMAVGALGVIFDAAVDGHNYHAGAMRDLVHDARAWLAAQGIMQLTALVPRSGTADQAFWRALGASDWTQWLWMKS